MTDADGSDFPPEGCFICGAVLGHSDWCASTARARLADQMYPKQEWTQERGALSVENEEVLKRRIREARNDIDEFRTKLTWLQSLPAEPESEDGDGPVIFFRKKFGGSVSIPPHGYQYAAVKAHDDCWFLTGSKALKAPSMTWRELLAFIYMRETEETSPAVWMAIQWEVL